MNGWVFTVFNVKNFGNDKHNNMVTIKGLKTVTLWWQKGIKKIKNLKPKKTKNMDTLIQQIIDLRNQGKSYRAVQKILNISPTKISQAIKDFPDMFKPSVNKFNSSSSSSSSAIATDSSIATAIDRGIKSDGKDVNISNPRKNSPAKANDPSDLKVIKKMQIKHEQTIKKMEYDEKEKERDFEREKRENAIRDKQIEEGKDDTIKKLWEQNRELNNMVTQSKVEKETVEETYKPDLKEKEPEPIDPEFDEDIIDFTSNLLEKDEKDLNEEQVNSILAEINKLKRRFKKICREDVTDITDFDEWKILIATEKYLKERLEEFGFWTSSVEFTIEKKWRKFLEEFIEPDNE